MPGASLSEVAKAGGVSLATASRVLNPDNTHPVSEPVRARVLAAAERLDFSVNGLARGLKVKRTNTVAADGPATFAMVNSGRSAPAPWCFSRL